MPDGPPHTLPAPRDDDDEDVSWALSTAASLVLRGDADEALRWLRKAAEAASQVGHEARALELFKAAASLADSLQRANAGARAARTLVSDDEPTPQALPYRFPELARALASRRDTLEEAPTAPEPELARLLAGRAIDSEATQEMHSDRRRAERAAMLDEITEVPFTQKAASQGAALSSTDPSRQIALPGEDTIESMRQSSRYLRVIVLAASDGEARVMRLSSGGVAPAGSATALLVPASPEDARVLASLLR